MSCRPLSTAVTAHLGLAARGWLPWRLWVFLEDGHRRGTLRQAGATWQFRHVVLQDHLVTAARAHQLRARTQAGDWFAALRLADLLATHGRIDELRRRADAHGGAAARRLAGMLAQQGHVDGAIAFLRPLAKVGDVAAETQLIDLLARHGREEDLRVLAGRRHPYALRRLADLLTEQGRPEEAIAFLRSRADAGDWNAVAQLTDLLSRHRHLRGDG